MSERVLLRDVIQQDLPVLFEHQMDPLACEMAAFPSRPLDAFIAHWRRLRADKDMILRTIIYSGQVAGTIMSFMQEDRRQVGYWIGREYWGRGIATQALALFLEQVKMRPLYAHVAVHNKASLRVLEKCGFNITAEELGMTFQGQPVPDYVLCLE